MGFRVWGLGFEAELVHEIMFGGLSGFVLLSCCGFRETPKQVELLPLLLPSQSALKFL